VFMGKSPLGNSPFHHAHHVCGASEQGIGACKAAGTVKLCQPYHPGFPGGMMGCAPFHSSHVLREKRSTHPTGCENARKCDAGTYDYGAMPPHHHLFILEKHCGVKQEDIVRTQLKGLLPDVLDMDNPCPDKYIL
jgi:hypothetical protein